MQATYARDVRDFIVSDFLLGRGDSLKEDTSFLEAGIIDSTGILELVAFLEERYAIQITDEELVPENLDSIHRIVGYLEKKLAKSPAVSAVSPETGAPLSSGMVA